MQKIPEKSRWDEYQKKKTAKCEEMALLSPLYEKKTAPWPKKEHVLNVKKKKSANMKN